MCDEKDKNVPIVQKKVKKFDLSFDFLQKHNI